MTAIELLLYHQAMSCFVHGLHAFVGVVLISFSESACFGVIAASSFTTSSCLAAMFFVSRLRHEVLELVLLAAFGGFAFDELP
jgi:hypothetical protein